MAATLFKIDLYEGTSLFTPAQDARQARARRPVVVTGLAGTRADLHEANAAIIAELGPNHPDLPSLPLQGVESRFWGVGQTMSTAVYGHDRFSNPTQDPFALVSWRYARERQANITPRIYRYQPATDSYAWEDVVDGQVYPPFDASGKATIAAFSMGRDDASVLQCAIHAGRLAADPRNTLEDLYDHYNSDAVCLNGVTCEPITLKFRYADVTPIDANGTVVYATQYIFDFCAQGYGSWNLTMNYESTPHGYGNTRTFTHNTPKNTEAFAGAFPTFSGSGPTVC